MQKCYPPDIPIKATHFPKIPNFKLATSHMCVELVQRARKPLPRPAMRQRYYIVIYVDPDKNIALTTLGTILCRRASHTF
jgi:hypothetical protein